MVVLKIGEIHKTMQAAVNEEHQFGVRARDAMKAEFGIRYIGFPSSIMHISRQHLHFLADARFSHIEQQISSTIKASSDQKRELSDQLSKARKVRCSFVKRSITY
jgi:hypothetical protein